MTGVNGNMLFTPNSKLYKIMFTLDLMNTLQHMQIVISVDIYPPVENRSNMLFTQSVGYIATWDDICSESYIWGFINSIYCMYTHPEN